MARLKAHSLLGDQDSDGSDFCPVERGEAKENSIEGTAAKLRTSPRKKAAKAYFDDGCASSEDSDRMMKPVQKPSSHLQPRGKQMRLAPLSAVSLASPFGRNNSYAKDSRRLESSFKLRSPQKGVCLPHQTSTEPVAFAKKTYESDNSVEFEIEESIWCGSDGTLDDSDEELPSPRTFLKLQPRPSNRERKPEALDCLSRNRDLTSNESGQFWNPTEFTKKLAATTIAQSRPTSSSDKENNGAFLRFSPPRLHNTRKLPPQSRPVTPPQSPSKSRLQSPSKTKSRLPTPPLRQSLDGFWSPNTVNNWNDQYSPQKILKSPRKLKFLRDDALASPTSSPRKAQSPSKATRAEREAKKDFESRKRVLAEEFLSELDEKITGGKIKELAASTAGVKLIWSKTLNSTAGRANWRKETTKTRKLDGTNETTHKHHASIELAEKVIDDEHRLLNVIAHEFCHLANFMISGIKDQPHGRQFKEWGRKCTQAFNDRGVEVTTKHSYQIEYKYIWQCSNEDCAVEFKRHSKSIDPKRHTCGTCRSKLVQIKPAPRKDAGNGTGYAAYVKVHFAEVKRSMPGASQKEVMEAVGKKYRADKAAKSGTAVVESGVLGKDAVIDLNAVAERLEIITLDDD